jgi:hypothetical protein
VIFLQILGIVVVLALIALGIVWWIRRKANLNRSLNMVFLRISVPIKDSKEEREKESEQYSSGKSQKEVNDVMTHFFEALHTIYDGYMINLLKGEDFFSCEYVLLEGQLQFFVVMPQHLKSLFDKQITAFYPDVFVEQVEDYSIFRQGYKATGRYIRLTKPSMFPIRTYQFLGSDPFNNLANAFSKIEADEGAAIQVMLRPLGDGWQEKGRKAAQELFMGKKKKSLLQRLNVLAWIGNFVRLMVQGA